MNLSLSYLSLLSLSRCQLLTQLVPFVCAVVLLLLLLFLPLQPVVAARATMEYYHYNHQGSLLEVYDGATNKRLLSQAWSPWGERHVLHASVSGDKNNIAALLAGGLPAHLSFTGHKALLATGLVFAGDTRLYDPRLKRFLNSDDRTTVGVRGQNRYSYAYNNPMTFIDPDGRAPRRWSGFTIASSVYRYFRGRRKNTVNSAQAYQTHMFASANAAASMIQKYTRGFILRKKSPYRFYVLAREAYNKEFDTSIQQLGLHFSRRAIYEHYYSTRILKHTALEPVRLRGFIPRLPESMGGHSYSMVDLLAFMHEHSKIIAEIKLTVVELNFLVLFGVPTDRFDVMAPNLGEPFYQINQQIGRIQHLDRSLKRLLLIPHSSWMAMISASQTMFPELWMSLNDANPWYGTDVSSLSIPPFRPIPHALPPHTL